MIALLMPPLEGVNTKIEPAMLQLTNQLKKSSHQERAWCILKNKLHSLKWGKLFHAQYQYTSKFVYKFKKNKEIIYDFCFMRSIFFPDENDLIDP